MHNHRLLPAHTVSKLEGEVDEEGVDSDWTCAGEEARQDKEGVGKVMVPKLEF